MKKRNLLVSLLSLALVAVVGVGATLAYLTDNTQTLNNTFVMDDLKITLKEDASVPSDQVYQIKKTEDKTFGTDDIIGAEQGIDYIDVLPGATVEKKPYITVSASNAHAYVYAYVTGVTAPLSVTWSDGWTEVETDLTGTLLRREVAKNAAGSYDVFTQVQVAAAANGEETLNNITIKAYAHQADNVESTVADAAAIDYFTKNP